MHPVVTPSFSVFECFLVRGFFLFVCFLFCFVLFLFCFVLFLFLFFVLFLLFLDAMSISGHVMYLNHI